MHEYILNAVNTILTIERAILYCVLFVGGMFSYYVEEEYLMTSSLIDFFSRYLFFVCDYLYLDIVAIAPNFCSIKIS